MTNLGSYLQDGADYQAKAVLAYLQREPELEASYFEVECQEFRKMADWIKKELNNYYREKTKETEKA